MAHDFVPNWLMGLAPVGQSTPARTAQLSPLVPRPLSLPALSPPELAVLVGELFAEGSLSWEQLRSLVEVPELAPHLRAALDAIATRRLAAAE